jgi:indole-3-glycerol phosphate synthase
MTILDEIMATKRDEVAEAKKRISPNEMADQAWAIDDAPRGFRQALCAADAPVVIAEVKRMSPSKGLIREDFDPAKLARGYQAGGAAAISVLTDESYFGGHLEFLSQVRGEVDLPVLRKDFVFDGYQIDEARVAGADAVLLIVSTLSSEQLSALHDRATGLGLDVLVEVHDEAELEVALASGADLIGVNNRDLRSFDVDLSTTERVAAAVPKGAKVLVVAESGIGGPADIRRLQDCGAQAFLVGESLMRQADVTQALNELRRLH